MGDLMPSCPYPSLELTPDLSLPVPDRDECEALWEKYAMLPNIRAHSRAVADVAMSLARRAEDMGIDLRRFEADDDDR